MSLKSKIGLGTVQFGMDYGISNKNGKPASSEVENILKYAKLGGIDTLDTASAYGESEEVLGKIGVDFFKVISKCLPEKECGLAISEQLDVSLKKLNLKILYAYLVHRPKSVINDPNQWNQMKKMKDLGTVNKIGFSLNEPEEIMELLEKGIRPDLVQVPYNYFDRRFENLIKTLHSNGCEVHSRSSFLQGLFFRDPETLPSHFDQVKNMIQKVRMSTDTLAGSLLRFVLDRPFIDKVIIGVESEVQLKENIEHLNTITLLPEVDFEISNSILNPTKWPKN